MEVNLYEITMSDMAMRREKLISFITKHSFTDTQYKASALINQKTSYVIDQTLFISIKINTILIIWSNDFVSFEMRTIRINEDYSYQWRLSYQLIQRLCVSIYSKTIRINLFKNYSNQFIQRLFLSIYSKTCYIKREKTIPVNWFKDYSWMAKHFNTIRKNCEDQKTKRLQHFAANLVMFRQD
jgi:hypothetical protein